jgi:hypothetical protein
MALCRCLILQESYLFYNYLLWAPIPNLMRLWQTVQSVVTAHRGKWVWPPPKVFFSLLCKECLMKTSTTSHMLQDMRIEVRNILHIIHISSSLGNQTNSKQTSRHKESKQADNNMQTYCQAINCSVAKLSTNMSRLNTTCSAWQPHQVVQIGLGHFELDVPVRPIISYWMLSLWKLHDIWYVRDSHCQHHQWQC